MHVYKLLHITYYINYHVYYYYFTLPYKIIQLQNNIDTRDSWIEYSARDAVATWHVRDKLITELKKMPWTVDGMRKDGSYMSDYYQQYLCPFGELLTEMERNGIKVDTKIHLKNGKYNSMFIITISILIFIIPTITIVIIITFVIIIIYYHHHYTINYTILYYTILNYTILYLTLYYPILLYTILYYS